MANGPDEISGSVERITYHNTENGYTVLRLNPDKKGMLPFKYATGKDAFITVVGNLPEVQPGEWLKLSGKWLNHAKHGRQFTAEKCVQTLPANVEGIKRYLGSGMIRGVGKVMAGRIVDMFGEDTLEVIEQQPERLSKVIGIGKKRVVGIQKAWDEQKAIKEVMIFLQSHGVTTGLATKIYKKYGDDSLEIVQNTPYKMVADIHGIGFKSADKIAQALGLKHDDPGRIEAGIAYTLNTMSQQGHVYVPQAELEPKAAEILGLGEEKITYIIETLEGDDLIKRERIGETPQLGKVGLEIAEPEMAVYLTPLYYSEVGVTNRIKALMNYPTSRVRSGRKAVSTAKPKGSSILSEEQMRAVEIALDNKVAVLTGGPGTGKTTTLRAVLDGLDAIKKTYALASPTGRAAKRLSEATGREAKTIHRLLEFKPGSGFARKEDYPLDADMVIIDETSMLDVVLANTLLKAIRPDSHVLFVGDVDQLPSVGAGDVLRDLIRSEVPAVITLTQIFRQAQNSLIIQNAHRINQGKMPITPDGATDFFMFVKEEPEELADLIVDLVKRRIPAKFGIDPFDDMQILCPMYNGAVGVTNLNKLLQQGLNPGGGRKGEKALGGRTFRQGDKVMQMVNNYDKNVFNGDIGRITNIDTVQQLMTVNVDGNPVVYDFLEADELVHAYAVSVHKSQGSEYPVVLIPVVTQHYMMLQRNLLYTAVTRAKKVVILAGTRRALAMAVKNNKVSQRHTALDWRLKG
ncbi:MAG: exodeoxyribonuclease V alpha subunit [Cellvibrionaceae bacterium]|jgi:exodeoxyribonuclease V alpha subunit